MKNIVDLIVKEARWVIAKSIEVHFKNVDDDSNVVLKQIDMLKKQIDDVFDNIEVTIEDASFSHGFGTQKEEQTLVDNNDIIKFVVKIDDAKFGDIEKIVKDFPAFVNSQIKKKDNVKFKLVFKIEKKKNNNEADISAEWIEV